MRWTETVQVGDPRAAEFNEAKQQFLFNLIDSGSFEIVVREEEEWRAGGHLNIMPAESAIALKHKEGGTVAHLARSFIGGHSDRHRDHIVHNASAASPQSVRLLLALAASSGLDLWSLDADQVYHQSLSDLERNAYINDGSINFHPHELAKLFRPVYGLADAGDLWARTLVHHYPEILQIT